MKVKALIEKLQELPQDAVVVLHSLEDSPCDTEYRPVVECECCFYSHDEEDGGMVFGGTDVGFQEAVLLHSDPERLDILEEKA